MTDIDKQRIPAAYYREVNVDSTIKYMGQVITVLAKGSETNGCFAFMEVKVRPGLEPPPHIHEREHELFFVLEGAIRFYTPERTFDVQAGGVGFLPQGKPHTFACLTEEILPVRSTAVALPQMWERDHAFDPAALAAVCAADVGWETGLRAVGSATSLATAFRMRNVGVTFRASGDFRNS